MEQDIILYHAEAYVGLDPDFMASSSFNSGRS